MTKTEAYLEVSAVDFMGVEDDGQDDMSNSSEVESDAVDPRKGEVDYTQLGKALSHGVMGSRNALEMQAEAVASETPLPPKRGAQKRIGLDKKPAGPPPPGSPSQANLVRSRLRPTPRSRTSGSS